MQLLRELPGRSLLPRLTLPSPVKGANRKLGSTFEACSHFFARLLLGVIGRGVALRGRRLQMQILFFCRATLDPVHWCAVSGQLGTLGHDWRAILLELEELRRWDQIGRSWWMLIRFVSPSYASCFSRRQRLKVDNFFSVISKVFLNVKTILYLVQDSPILM